jgi:signal transduction histidine kinase
MEPIQSLISGFTEACAVAVTPRAIADTLCERLVQKFPSSSALVFERDAGRNTVRVVAGANVPNAWVQRSVAVRDVPLLADALGAPDRIHVRAAYTRGTTDPTQGLPITALEALCAAVPDQGAGNYVLLLLVPPNVSDAATRKASVDAARQLMSAGISIAAGDSDRAVTISRVYNAKVEWEATADAVDAIVAVVDHRQRVMRVNRAVERWVGVPVREAVGRDLHGLLHSACTRRHCSLRTAIDGAVQSMEQNNEAKFELFDDALARDLQVEFRYASTSADGWLAVAEPPRMACIVYDMSALRTAERELMFLNQSLEERVRTRTQELTEANRALREEISRRRESETSLLRSQRDLTELSNQLVDAQELERKRIAQDLHDSVGQSLTAIKYSLENAQVLIERERATEAAKMLETGARRVREVLVDVRNISMNLRPAVLDDLGAASAIRYLCREWHEVYSTIDLTTDIGVDDRQIPDALGTDIFRSVQELLNNIARHAHAQRVRVEMGLHAGDLSVVVTDDGDGFEPSSTRTPGAAVKESRGLRGLRERTERLGGRYRIESAPGAGTAVHLHWPVSLHAANPASVLIN